MTEYLPDIPTILAIWLTGSAFGCWGVYSTKAPLPDKIRYLIAIFWPIALIAYCVLCVIGLLNEARKNIFAREGA